MCVRVREREREEEKTIEYIMTKKRRGALYMRLFVGYRYSRDSITRIKRADKNFEKLFFFLYE